MLAPTVCRRDKYYAQRVVSPTSAPSPVPYPPPSCPIVREKQHLLIDTQAREWANPSASGTWGKSPVRRCRLCGTPRSPVGRTPSVPCQPNSSATLFTTCPTHRSRPFACSTGAGAVSAWMNSCDGCSRSHPANTSSMELNGARSCYTGQSAALSIPATQALCSSCWSSGPSSPTSARDLLPSFWPIP